MGKMFLLIKQLIALVLFSYYIVTGIVYKDALYLFLAVIFLIWVAIFEIQLLRLEFNKTEKYKLRIMRLISIYFDRLILKNFGKVKKK